MKVSICCVLMTTKNSKKRGLQEGVTFDLILFDCPCCGSTKAKRINKTKKQRSKKNEKTN